MGFWNLLKFSTRMFKARTSRTVLTILGMSVGIGAILFLVSLGFGVQKTLLETITTADSMLTLDVYSNEQKQNISLTDILNIKRLPGTDYISPVMETVGRLKYGGLVTEAKVAAVDEKFLDLEGLTVILGQKLNNQAPGGIIISSALARIFEKTPEEMLGENIVMSLTLSDGNDLSQVEANYKIIGLVDKKDIVVYVNQLALGDALPVVYSRIKVKSVSSQALNDLRGQITDGGFIVSAVTDIINQVEKTFQVVRIILGLFGAIALIVSAIGMFNTMVVTLLERTEEIGVMKSIGASNHDILWMFVFESTIMGFLGGIIGIIFGYIGGLLFNLFFNLIAQRMGGYAASLFYFPGWFLLFILVVATIVGFFTGLIPARKASQTDPLEALRYK